MIGIILKTEVPLTWVKITKLDLFLYHYSSAVCVCHCPVLNKIYLRLTVFFLLFFLFQLKNASIVSFVLFYY